MRVNESSEKLAILPFNRAIEFMVVELHYDSLSTSSVIGIQRAEL
jgi:hypothetical protein